MSSHEQQAKVLAEALPYIQKFTGKTVVVKYGGNAMISQELRKAVMSDIILLNLVGIRVVAVHGGGPEIGAMLKKLGKESKFVDGLRYTDEETMDVVQQILCGAEVGRRSRFGPLGEKCLILANAADHKSSCSPAEGQKSASALRQNGC